MTDHKIGSRQEWLAAREKLLKREKKHTSAPDPSCRGVALLKKGLGNYRPRRVDYLHMDCEFYREAISARIDGESAVTESAALDAHLAGCAACQRWAEAALRVTRQARVTPAEPVPDLTTAIMARVAPTIGRRSRGGRESASPVAVARLGLLLVGLAQVCLAVPALLGDDAGAPIHIAHEQGSWFLALGVGLLIVAWRPVRAASMLPLVGVLTAALVTTTVADITAGRTQAATEAPHGLAFLGLALLWALAHPLHGRSPHTTAGPV